MHHRAAEAQCRAHAETHDRARHPQRPHDEVIAFDGSGALKWKVSYGPETLEKMATGSRATPTTS